MWGGDIYGCRGTLWFKSDFGIYSRSVCFFFVACFFVGILLRHNNTTTIPPRCLISRSDPRARRRGSHPHFSRRAFGRRRMCARAVRLSPVARAPPLAGTNRMHSIIRTGNMKLMHTTIYYCEGYCMYSVLNQYMHMLFLSTRQSPSSVAAAAQNYQQHISSAIEIPCARFAQVPDQPIATSNTANLTHCHQYMHTMSIERFQDRKPIYYWYSLISSD
jgi:hypothetical protein